MVPAPKVDLRKVSRQAFKKAKGCEVETANLLQCIQGRADDGANCAKAIKDLQQCMRALSKTTKVPDTSKYHLLKLAKDAGMKTTS